MSDEGHLTILDEREVLLHASNDFCPHLRELGRAIRVRWPETMHILAALAVIVRYRTDQRVIVIDYLAVPDDTDTNGADACLLEVGRLKIYGYEV